MAVVKTSISAKTSIELKVYNFLDLLNISNCSLESLSFELNQAKILLRICTSDEPCQMDKNVGWIGLYLLAKGFKGEVAFRIGIKNADSSVFKSVDDKLLDNSDEDGFKGVLFIQRSELLGSKDTVAEDGSLTIFCSFCFSSAIAKDVPSQTSSSDDIPTLSKDLKQLYLDGQYADVKMKVKDKEFTTHKCILASRSKVFAAIFQNTFSERNRGTVEVDDSDPESFEQFLLHLYTGSLDVVNSDNAISLYKTADKYGVKELKEECAHNMSQQLSVDSFCDVVRLATMHDDTDLLTAATTFYINNLKTILQTTKWQEFFAENPLLGNELFIKYLVKSEKD